MSRFLRSLVLTLAFLCASLVATAQPAEAKVRVSFHSFNGSVLIVCATGPAVLAGPVAHTIWVEEQKWIGKTNRHFTLTVDDATYRKMRAEVEAWRNAPGKYYDLDTRNCIHFVGRIAQLGGLKVDYPKNLLRKPRAWLNHVSELNPQLGAKAIRG